MSSSSMKRVWAALMAALACVACGSPAGVPWVGTPPSTERPADVTVLMMGNSHTAYNNLPQQLDTMLLAGLAGKAVATAEAPGWMFLDQRLADTPSMRLLASRRWSVVVLQAQKYSSSGQFSYSTSEAEELIRRARAAGALPVLFPEWPRRGVAETQRIYELHASIARAEPACVAPVGQAWDLAAQRHPGLVLHAADGNHAAPAGSYLAALMLYTTITGASPLALPDQDNGVPAAVQAQLRQVAADTAQSTSPRQHCPADAPLTAADFNSTLERLWQQNPRHHGAAYVAARRAARSGNEALALRWLDRLLQAGLGDALDPDDFAAITSSPAYRQRAAAFAAAAPAVGAPQRVLDTTCADLLPEGTAWDPKRRRLLLSSGRQRTVFTLDAEGDCRPLVPSADGGLLAVLGMGVDAGSDTLWVASAAAPFMQAAQPAEAGTTLLARIDLQQGRTVQTWRLPGPGLLNDLALAPDGSVYVTESQGGTVYRLAPAQRALVPIFPAGTFEGPNGIVALNADTLVVADFHGLWLVDGAAGGQPTRRRLQGADGQYLGGFDGLALAGSHLVGIQNLVGLSRVWWLQVDAAEARVQARLLLRGHADLRNPTTGAVADGYFHFIADPNLQMLQPDGSLSPVPPPRLGHRLLSLRLPNGPP
jgi:sugar lactone lactonase YvrE